jgi:hypothetical protein
MPHGRRPNGAHPAEASDYRSVCCTNSSAGRLSEPVIIFLFTGF